MTSRRPSGLKRTLVNATPSHPKQVGLRKCHYCRQWFGHRSLTIDHMTPRCRGGAHSKSNVVLACQECNQAKGPLTEHEYFAVRNDPIELAAAVKAVLRSLEQHHEQ